MNNFDIYICIILNIVCLLIGYIFGSIKNKNAQSVSTSWCIQNKEQKKQQEKKQTLEKIKAIDIDNSKMVIIEDISGLEKKFDSIGNTTDVHDNIESSINKLSQIMKGR